MRQYEVLPADNTEVRRLYDIVHAEERNALVKIEDGKVVDVVAFDGGAPEDNSLERDWSWVAPELTKAYRQGFEDARKRSAQSIVDALQGALDFNGVENE